MEIFNFEKSAIGSPSTRRSKTIRYETIRLPIRNWEVFDDKIKINVAFSFVSPDGGIISLTFDILMKEMLFELLTLTRTDFLCISRAKFFFFAKEQEKV